MLGPDVMVHRCFHMGGRRAKQGRAAARRSPYNSSFRGGPVATIHPCEHPLPGSIYVHAFVCSVCVCVQAAAAPGAA